MSEGERPNSLHASRSQLPMQTGSCKKKTLLEPHRTVSDISRKPHTKLTGTHEDVECERVTKQHSAKCTAYSLRRSRVEVEEEREKEG